VSDANVVKLLQPGSFADPLTEVLRNGARALLAQAIEAEVAEFLAKHVDLKTATGLLDMFPRFAGDPSTLRLRRAHSDYRRKAGSADAGRDRHCSNRECACRRRRGRDRRQT